MNLPRRRAVRGRTPGARTVPRLRLLVMSLVAALVAVGLLAADHPLTATTVSLWGEGTPPELQVAADTESVTLGTAFRPAVPGEIVGLRYWSAGSGMTGPEGGLWAASGELLASARFGSPRSAGWQTVMLAEPVKVVAGGGYVAAYHAPTGSYPVTEHFLGTSESNLLQVDPGASGVYAYGGSLVFPSSEWQQSQYWVDVVFRGDPAATPLPSALVRPAPTPTSGDDVSTASPTPSAPGTPAPSPTPTGPTTASVKPAATSTPRPRPTAAVPARPAAPPAAQQAVPLPPPASKPGPSNTGVPAGTVLTPAAGLTVTTPNQVLNGLDIHGEVVIQAPGVQIRNSRISGDDYYGVLVQSGSVTITDTEISGFENAIAGDGWTALRVNIHSVTGDGVKLGSGVTLRSSWIHDLTPAPGAHADGAQMQDGVTGLVVADNAIEPGDAANSAIFLAPDLGPTTNGPVTITGNWLDGGGYALFCLDGANGRYVVRNITISGNRFGSTSGYGAARITVPVTFVGNVDAAGLPISL